MLFYVLSEKWRFMLKRQDFFRQIFHACMQLLQINSETTYLQVRSPPETVGPHRGELLFGRLARGYPHHPNNLKSRTIISSGMYLYQQCGAVVYNILIQVTYTTYSYKNQYHYSQKKKKSDLWNLLAILSDQWTMGVRVEMSKRWKSKGIVKLEVRQNLNRKVGRQIGIWLKFYNFSVD